MCENAMKTLLFSLVEVVVYPGVLGDSWDGAFLIKITNYGIDFVMWILLAAVCS